MKTIVCVGMLVCGVVFTQALPAPENEETKPLLVGVAKPIDGTEDLLEPQESRWGGGGWGGGGWGGRGWGGGGWGGRGWGGRGWGGGGWGRPSYGWGGGGWGGGWGGGFGHGGWGR